MNPVVTPRGFRTRDKDCLPPNCEPEEKWVYLAAFSSMMLKVGVSRKLKRRVETLEYLARPAGWQLESVVWFPVPRADAREIESAILRHFINFRQPSTEWLNGVGIDSATSVTQRFISILAQPTNVPRRERILELLRASIAD